MRTQNFEGCSSQRGDGRRSFQSEPVSKEQARVSMNVNTCLPSEVASVSFSPLSSADIRRLSVLHIVNPQLFDSLNQPNPQGLYDERLGPFNRSNTCLTCHQTSAFCPGHFGHMDLPRPVFHPLFMSHLYILLRSACLYCHHFKASPYECVKLAAQLHLLDHGLVAESDSLASEGSKFMPKSKAKSSSKSGPAEMDQDQDDQEHEDGALKIDDYRRYMNERVQDIISAIEQETGKKLSRDNYKTGPASDARRQLVNAFQKLCVNRRKCEHCGAFANRYRKEQYLRFMELSLTHKQATHNKSIEAHRPSKQLLKAKLLRLTAQRQRSEAPYSNGGDMMEEDDQSLADDEEERMRQQARREASEDGSEDSDDEGPGEDLMEVDEPQQEQSEPTAKKAKAKASITKQTESILHTDEVQLHMRILFTIEAALVDRIYGPHGPMSITPANLSTASPRANADMFFMDVIAVPPSRFRPASVMGEKTFENPQNELLSKVLSTTIRIRDRHAELRLLTDKKAAQTNGSVEDLVGSTDPVRVYEQLLVALDDLQNAVNGLIDAGKNSAAPRGREPPPGVKQVLEKKEGLFRMNMMVSSTHLFGTNTCTADQLPNLGQAGQLCSQIRDFAGCQYRNQRNRRAAGLCQEVDVPGTCQ